MIDVIKWAERDLSKFCKSPVKAVSSHAGDDLKDPYSRFVIYTNTNEYVIASSGTYLGCTATSRKKRPGEDWHRGNDLPDGPCTEETWIEILKAIVSYELVDVVVSKGETTQLTGSIGS